MLWHICGEAKKSEKKSFRFSRFLKKKIVNAEFFLPADLSLPAGKGLTLVVFRAGISQYVNIVLMP